MMPHGSPPLGKALSSQRSAGSLGTPPSGCVLDPMPPTAGATLQSSSPWGSVGVSLTCRHAMMFPAGGQGQGWLTEGVEL